MHSELSEELEVKVRTFFAVVVDIVTEFSGEGMLSELLYTDDE